VVFKYLELLRALEGVNEQVCQRYCMSLLLLAAAFAQCQLVCLHRLGR
jgi:hypothetical protein